MTSSAIADTMFKQTIYRQRRLIDW